MNGPVASGEHASSFKSPDEFLAGVDAETTGRVIAAATDVALVVEGGVIKDIALGSQDLSRESYLRSWRDKPWVDTVTVESRPKIERLLTEAASKEVHWHQVNHPSSAGLDLPVRYTAVQTDGDRVVALGRELRSTAELQQRLVEAHQKLERDYVRLREAEARYKLLFRVVTQPLVIVVADSSVVEVGNPAAVRLLGHAAETIEGSTLDALFSNDSRVVVRRSLAAAASQGEARPASVKTAEGESCQMMASAFREDAGMRLIVRLTPDSTGQGESADEDNTTLTRALEALPDGLVVAGSDLQIVLANRAFTEMVQAASDGPIVGSRLSEHVGRSPTETNLLISNLRNHGVVRNFATVLRDRFDNEQQVEVSAVSAPVDGRPMYGLSVRNVERRIGGSSTRPRGLPTSAEQLTGLVGHVSLKEIVREATDVIERLCIEAALEVTNSNRASAAEMLGLSRQSLYSKLKRFGLEDPQ